jgi:PAS domain S-box-containing protein
MKILHLEDVQQDAELIEHLIVSTFPDCEYRLEDSEKGLRQVLESFNPDIILSDYSMKQFDGLRALKISRQLMPGIPFIIVTGTMNEDIAVECIKAGAVDYLIKDNLKRLESAIVQAIGQRKIQLQKTQVDALVKQKQYLLERITSAIPSAIYIIDIRSNEILFTNNKMAQLLGFVADDESYVEEVPLNRICPEDEFKIPKLHEALNNAKQDEVIEIEYRMQNKQGEWQWLRSRDIVFERDKNALLTHILVSISDINASKQAEIQQRKMDAKLAESEKKYRAIFENIQDIYFETSRDGIILEVSPSVSSLSLTREELIGTNTLQFFSDQEQSANLYKIMVQKGSVTDYDITLKNKRGKKLFFSVTARMLTQNQDGTQIISGVMRNVSERVRNREELIEAKEKAEEMNKVKSFFLANMSHELRTPLSGILGFSDLLLTSITEPGAHEMLELIHHSGKRLLRTLDSILDLSRIESNKPEIQWQLIDLNSFLSEKIKLFKAIANAKQIELKYIDLKQITPFTTDINMLEHIINALVENALKYTEKGEIELSAEKLVLKHKNWVIIKVRDTGIGIDLEDQKIIFEPFRQASEGYSRAYEGTGLGLAIAKKLVALLDGSISVESSLAEGTTFVIKLPDSEGISDTDDSQLQIPLAIEHEETEWIPLPILPKLLVVDDDGVTRIMVQSMLKDLYDIDFAETGKKALQMINETQYQMFLMDINLAASISGIEIVHFLRKSEKYSNTPVIAVTAYAMLGDRERFLEEGFTEYLSKPFTKNELLATIKNTIQPSL